MKKVLLLFVSLLSLLPLLTAIASNDVYIKLTADCTEVCSESEFNVKIDICNNPGIVAACLKINFDKGLSLIDAKNGTVFQSLSFIKPKQLANSKSITSECNFVWSGSDIESSKIKDGTILQLKFKINEKVKQKKDYMITVSNEQGNVIDKNMNSFMLKSGFKIRVVQHKIYKETYVKKATFEKNGFIAYKYHCSRCSQLQKVEKQKISKIKNIYLSNTSLTYSGKAQKPTVTVKDANGKTVSSKNYTLSYSKGCTAVGTYSVKVTFKGNYSGTKTLSFTIAPAAVKNLKATQTTSSVTLTWSKSSGAAKYVVYLYNTKTKKYEKKATVTATKATIKNLKSGTSYKFAVVVFDKTGKLKSANAVLTTATAPVAPSITVTAGKKQATVKWNKVTGATNYTVYFATSKNGAYKAAGTTSKTSLTVSKLSSGKTYYFKVIANEKLGSATIKSAYSAVKSVKVK